MLPTPPNSANNTPRGLVMMISPGKTAQRRSSLFSSLLDTGACMSPSSSGFPRIPATRTDSVYGGSPCLGYPASTHSLNDRPQNDRRLNMQSLAPPNIPINCPKYLTPPNLPNVDNWEFPADDPAPLNFMAEHAVEDPGTIQSSASSASRDTVDTVDTIESYGPPTLPDEERGEEEKEPLADPITSWMSWPPEDEIEFGYPWIEEMRDVLHPVEGPRSLVPGQTCVSLNTDNAERLTKFPGVHGQFTEVEPSTQSPSNCMPEHKDNQIVYSTNEDQCPGVQGEIMEWVDATGDVPSVPSTPPLIPSAATSASSSPAVAPQGLLTGEAVMNSSSILILELLKILQNKDQEIDIDEASPTDHSTLYSTDSSPPATDGSGPNDSPKSATPHGTVPFGRGIKRSFLPNRQSFEREDDDEPPRKKSGREQDSFTMDALTSTPNSVQMPCPLLELHGCQGTNTTISELLRCLQNRHRIVICKECCTQLVVPDDEKKPENVLKRHASGGCEPRCIGPSCSGVIDDTMPHHRRTEKCPSWKALSNEARWTFIWTLVNPGHDPPAPDFPMGVGFEHSTEQRPCKQQSRVKGNEICIALLRNVEAKDRRISTLENDLKDANNRNAQLQQRCDEKVSNLENIIETLLERLTDKNVSVPRSLQKRLQSECPKIMNEFLITSTPRQLQTPPTTGSITKDVDKGVPPMTPPTMQASVQNGPQQSAKLVSQQSHQTTNDMGLTMKQTSGDRLPTPLVEIGDDPAFDGLVDIPYYDTWWDSVDTSDMSFPTKS